MAGWLAGLDAFVVGLAYLVALLATRFVLRPLLAGVLSSAPFIGGWLTNNLDGAIARFEASIAPAANASMGTLVSALDWLTTSAGNVLGSVADLAEASAAGLYRLLTVSLPHATDLVLQQGEQLLAGVRTDLLQEMAVVRTDLGRDLAAAQVLEGQIMTVARTDLESEITAAEGIVLAEVRKAEQTAGQLWQQAEYDAAQAVAASESKLAALVTLARQDLSAAVGAVEHDLQLLAQAERVALVDSVSVLGGDIQAAEARAQQAVSALDEQLQKSIEGILGGLPWQSLAAAVGASEAVLQADVRTLVGLGAAEIRKAIGDAESLRARYGPQVRAALAQLKAG